MKKYSIACFIWSVIFIAGLFSCVSADGTLSGTSDLSDLSGSVPVEQAEVTGIDSEAAAAAGETAESADTAVSVEAVPDTASAEPVPNDPAEFLTVEAGKTPAAATKGSAFKSAFTVTVTDSRTKLPAAGVPVRVSYPEASLDGVISFAETELTSDAQGSVSFTAPVPSFSCNGEVVFSVGSDLAGSDSAGSAENRRSVSVPYKVKTNLQRRGGTISILDYTKSGKPVRDNSLSASAVLAALMKNGFSGIGLADFIDKIDSGDKNAVYRAAHNLIGNASAFFVFGTVKYDGDVRKTDDGYEVPLVADITCVDMSSGAHLYATEVRVTGTGKSEWAALNSARNDLLGPQTAERILYGM